MTKASSLESENWRILRNGFFQRRENSPILHLTVEGRNAPFWSHMKTNGLQRNGEMRYVALALPAWERAGRVWCFQNAKAGGQLTPFISETYYSGERGEDVAGRGVDEELRPDLVPTILTFMPDTITAETSTPVVVVRGAYLAVFDHEPVVRPAPSEIRSVAPRPVMDGVVIDHLYDVQRKIFQLMRLEIRQHGLRRLMARSGGWMDGICA